MSNNTVNPVVAAIVARRMPEVMDRKHEGLCQGAEAYMGIRVKLARVEGQIDGFFAARKAVKNLQKEQAKAEAEA